MGQMVQPGSSLASDSKNVQHLHGISFTLRSDSTKCPHGRSFCEGAEAPAANVPEIDPAQASLVWRHGPYTWTLG